MLLSETLKLHDHTQFEFHYIYFLPWKDQMEESLRHANGLVSCFEASNNISILMKYRHVAAYIKAHNIRVMHCHLPWAGFLGRLLFRGTGIPVFYTEHNKQERYHFITRWINRITFNWQTCAIAVSEDVADSIRQNIRPRIEVRTVWNGVNTKHFQRNQEAGKIIREKVGVPGDAIVVGTVAVFRTQKRIREWLNVFAAAASNQPRLWGILVGDGPLREEIREHRKHLGLEDRVLMPGLQADVVSWLSAMDIFMMTSLFEGLPVALLEAMSTSCAVLATDAGGIKEVIRNDIDGIKVPAENPGALVTHLVRLASSTNDRDQLAVAARERVKERFDLSVMTGMLEQLYHSGFDSR